MHHYQYHVFNFNFMYFTCYIDATLQSKFPSHRTIKYYLISTVHTLKLRTAPSQRRRNTCSQPQPSVPRQHDGVLTSEREPVFDEVWVHW